MITHFVRSRDLSALPMCRGRHRWSSPPDRWRRQMPVNNVSASSESLSRGPPPALLVPKTYDLCQSDVTATFWHGLWQLCNNNNNNKCSPVLPLLRFCGTGHRHLRLVHVTSHPDVTSFKQRLPASAVLGPKGLFSLTLSPSLSLTLAPSRSPLSLAPF